MEMIDTTGAPARDEDNMQQPDEAIVSEAQHGTKETNPGKTISVPPLDHPRNATLCFPTDDKIWKLPRTSNKVEILG